MCYRRPKASSFLGSTLLVISLFAVGSGCSPKSPDPPKKNKQKWTAPTNGTLTPAERRKLQERTWKSWKKFPDYLSALRAVLTHGAVDMETHVLTSTSENWYCPKARRKLNSWGRKRGTRPYYDAVWKSCGLSQFGLFNEAQFRRSPLVCILVVQLFERLKKLGLSAKAARALARSWVEPHPLLARATTAGIKLPTSEGAISIPIKRGVWISKEQLRFGDRSIAKLDVAARALQRSALPFPALGRALRGPKKASHVTLWADGRTPFGVINRVLTTAASAGLGCAHLMALGASGEPTVVPVGCRMMIGVRRTRPRRMVGVSATDGAPIATLGLTLHVGPRGISVRSKHGSECSESRRGPNCFPITTSYTPARIRPLLLHLWYLYANKYKDCSSFSSSDGCNTARHRIRVEVEASVPYRDVVTLIEAIRGAPLGATNPPSPGAKRGCGFDFLRPGHGFQDAVEPFTLYFPENDHHKRCMYSAPSLHLATARAK